MHHLVPVWEWCVGVRYEGEVWEVCVRVHALPVTILDSTDDLLEDSP